MLSPSTIAHALCCYSPAINFYYIRRDLVTYGLPGTWTISPGCYYGAVEPAASCALARGR